MKKVVGILSVVLILLAAIVSAKTIVVSKDPTAVLFELGKHEFNKGNIQESINAFSKIIEIDPDHEQAWHNLGIAQYELENYQDALKSLQQSIKIDPNYSKALYSLGLLYYELGDHEQALFHLQQVIVLEPDNINALFDAGVIVVDQFREKEQAGTLKEEDLNLLEQGKEYYERVVDLDPTFAHAQTNIEVLTTIINEYS